jgi:hypothetical protein
VETGECELPTSKRATMEAVGDGEARHGRGGQWVGILESDTRLYFTYVATGVPTA